MNLNQKTTCPHCTKHFEVPSELFNTVVSCPTCDGKFNPMKELVRESWELTKSPEYHDYQNAHISETNKNIAHADFVAGMLNGTLGFTCMSGAPYKFIRGARRTIFNIMVMLYMFAPAIIIPLWAWHEHNCWLLLGIIVSLLGTCIAALLIYNQQKQTSIGALLLIASVTSLLCLGIHSYCTIFVLSALWGMMLYMIADNVEREYAMQSLIENPEVFEDAIAQNKIMIERKDNESK